MRPTVLALLGLALAAGAGALAWQERARRTDDPALLETVPSGADSPLLSLEKQDRVRLVHRGLRSLPPDPVRGHFVTRGALSTFGTAGRHEMKPPRSLRSLPPEGAGQSLGTAHRD